jgi:YD repeat-containing protein
VIRVHGLLSDPPEPLFPHLFLHGTPMNKQGFTASHGLPDGHGLRDSGNFAVAGTGRGLDYGTRTNVRNRFSRTMRLRYNGFGARRARAQRTGTG